MPSIEPLEGSMFVTVTVSPKLYKYSSTTQFEMTCHELECLLKSQSSAFQCVPELTWNGNVHYHAWVKFDNKDRIITFVNKVKRLHHKFGFTKINNDVIIERERVANYMLKEYKITNKAIKSVRPIVLQSDHLDPRLHQYNKLKTSSNVPQFPKMTICETCEEIKDF